MSIHPHSFLFSDFALTRDPVTSRIDFDWNAFNQVIGASGIQPIMVSDERDLEFYVPMLITLYRYALAAGQPVDLAAEAINRDFDPHGTKEEVFRASVRRSICFDTITICDEQSLQIRIPQELRFADLALRTVDDAISHFNGVTLHKILIHSQVPAGALENDGIDMHCLAAEWYQLALLAGEPTDPFMESVRDLVKVNLKICGSTPSRATPLSPYGLVFSAPLGNDGELVPVRVPVDVQLPHLELTTGERCAWAPLHRILSVSGLDVETLVESVPASPSGQVPVSESITALIRAWVGESTRLGVPVDASFKMMTDIGV